MSFNQTYDEALQKARKYQERARKKGCRLGRYAPAARLARKTPLRAHKPLQRSKPGKPTSASSRGGAVAGPATGKRRKGLRRVGPRTKAWLTIWRWLKPRLEAAGRTSCEFDWIPHECWGRLDPAHSKKRRLWKGNDIYTVAIACQNVHAILDEQMAHEDMERSVIKAIDQHGGLILPKEREQC